MFIDKNSISITVDNNTINVGQYLTEVKYGYHKLWGNDSGRNLAGKQSGTLLGIFPKLTLQFRALTKDEVELLTPYLDSGYQNVTYYDANKQRSVTMETYASDYEITNKNIIGNDVKNEGFKCSLIATSRRS